MHGRLKVKTTAEQQAAKLKEQEKKLKLFSAAWDRLVAKRKNSDHDKETLELSAQILCKVPDVHTLWNMRKETFLYLKSELGVDEYAERCRDELAFIEHCLQVNPKSYGCWEHRCWLLDNSTKPDWANELTLCNRYLDMDERNFHCWDYRRFIVRRSSETKPADEFKYTTDKISANFSNFSSWHYRSKLLPVLYPDAANPVGIRQDILLGELEMVQSAFFTDPSDQSAWFYHRWLLGKSDDPVRCDLVHLSSDRRRLLARLTKAVKVFDAKIEVDSNESQVVWMPVGLDSEASMVWTSQLPSTLSKDSNLRLVFRDEERNESTELKVKINADGDCWAASSGAGGSFAAIEFGKAAEDVLSNELDMLIQLHELEPENKWAMLTIISLLRNLQPRSAMPDVEKFLEKLILVDPQRTYYYNDMRSKFVVENELRLHYQKAQDHTEQELEEQDHKEQELEARSFDLSSLELARFDHAEHFLLVTHLNLSRNNLTSLRGLHLLQNLRELNASRNKLVTLEHVGILPYLQVLNVEDNCLEDRSRLLDVVRKQPKLTKVLIEGNSFVDPISSDEIARLLESIVKVG